MIGELSSSSRTYFLKRKKAFVSTKAMSFHKYDAVERVLPGIVSVLLAICSMHC